MKKETKHERYNRLDAIACTGTEVRDISFVLDNMIDNLDEARKCADAVARARDIGYMEGYEKGFAEGMFIGHSDGYNEAHAKYAGRL
jgi:flagellar biosynthesis/type III secretory pathway protein FliH